MTARTSHEAQWAKALAWLKRKPLKRIEFERAYPGSRVNPAIQKLRGTLGYEIGGDGSTADPFRLLSPTPKGVVVTASMQEAYYQTSHWSSTRARRLHFDGHRCVQCHTGHELQVHHIRYSLFCENVERDLVTLCALCHEKMHAELRAPGFPKNVPLEVATRMGWKPEAWTRGCLF